MKAAMRSLGAIAGVLALALPAAAGAQDATPGAYVDVLAKPTIALAGQAVTISGSTGAYKNVTKATVSVRHESGTPAATLAAPVNDTGLFSVTFTDTKKPGKYAVSVTSPDGKGKGQTSFRVDSTGALLDDVERVSAELDQRANKLLTIVENAMNSLPPSGERDQVIKTIKEIEVKKSTVTLPPVKILGDLRKVNEISLPDQPVFGELRDWVSEGEAAIGSIDKSRISEQPAPVCETIHTALEGAKLAAYAFTVTDSLLKTLGKIAVEKLVPAGVKAVLGEGPVASGVSSSLKFDIEMAKKHHNVYEALLTLTLDATEFLIDQVFEHYCSEYKGAVNAKMTVVWKEGVQPWLKYGVVLDGQLRLRYPKEPPAGKPVYMTGEFEGNATDYTFWENVTVVSPIPKSILVVQRRWLPPPSFVNSAKSLEFMGQAARALTPSYFDVPVIAEMTGDTIKLQFKPARVDFTDLVKNRLLFVVYNGLYPDFKVFSFPIQKAHWILSKGLEDPAIFTLTKEASGTRAVKVKKQNHRDSADKSVSVDWTITIDAPGKAERGPEGKK